MKKHKITKKMLLFDDCSAVFVVLGILPAIIAIACVYFGVHFIHSNTLFAIILACVCVGCITIVIQMCRDLYYFLRKKMDILNDRFVVFEDSIDKKSEKKSTAIYFKKYSQQISKPTYFNVPDFEKAKVGDKYLMVKLNCADEILYMYPSARYQLDDKLKERKVKIAEAYPKRK